MSTDYERQRLKNIEANRKLLESLGLDVLHVAIPLASPVAKPKPKPKPKAKLVSIKRKVEERDGGVEGRKTKIARRDDEDDIAAAGARRRSSRRSAVKVDYNEDKLADSRQKYLVQQKERVEEAAEDAAGYVGNKLGKRKHDPCVNQQLIYTFNADTLACSSGNTSARSQEWRLEHGGKPGICYLASICKKLTPFRAQCSTDAIHAPFVAGISGSSTEGAYSVALSGGYDDDVDLGYALCVSL